MTALPPGGAVNTAYLRLSRLALGIDELVDEVDAWHLSDEQAALLGVPALHFRIALGRLDQILHEVEGLDQRPRLERLRAAA